MPGGAAQGPIAALLQQEERQRQQVRQRQASQGANPRPSTKPGQPWAAKPTEKRQSTTPKPRPSTPKTVTPNAATPQTAEKSQTERRSTQTLRHSQSMPGATSETPPMRKSQSGSERQNWEAFHRRSTSFLQERTALIDHLRAAKEEEELQSCTFAPNKSVQSDRPRSGVRVGVSLYERGVERERRKTERLQQMKQDLFDQEMANCSFQPQRSSSRRRASSFLQDTSVSSVGSGQPQPTGYAARAATARASVTGLGAPTMMQSSRGSLTGGRGSYSSGGYPAQKGAAGYGTSRGSHTARRDYLDGGSNGDSTDQFSFNGECMGGFGAGTGAADGAMANGSQAPSNGNHVAEDDRALQRRLLLQETFSMDAQRQVLPQQPYADVPVAPPLPQHDWRASLFGEKYFAGQAHQSAGVDPVAAAVSRMEGVLLEQLRDKD